MDVAHNSAWQAPLSPVLFARPLVQHQDDCSELMGRNLFAARLPIQTLRFNLPDDLLVPFVCPVGFGFRLRSRDTQKKRERLRLQWCMMWWELQKRHQKIALVTEGNTERLKRIWSGARGKLSSESTHPHRMSIFSPFLNDSSWMGMTACREGSVRHTIALSNISLSYLSSPFSAAVQLSPVPSTYLPLSRPPDLKDVLKWISA